MAELSPKAQTIIDALAVGITTYRQYAELQQMYWELPEEEQDAVDRWTTIGQQIREIRPGSTEPPPRLPMPEPPRVYALQRWAMGALSGATQFLRGALNGQRGAMFFGKGPKSGP